MLNFPSRGEKRRFLLFSPTRALGLDSTRLDSAYPRQSGRILKKECARGGRSWNLPRGVNTTAFTTYSRDYFSPRGERRRLAPRALSLQLLAPLYSVYTSRRLRFFGSRRATRPGSSGIERRVESSARSRVQQAHTFPYTRRRRSENGSDLRTDALSLRSASSTSGPTSKRTSYFLPIERERGRERERSVFFGRNLYRRLSIIIRGARSFFSSSFHREKERRKVARAELASLPKTFSLPRRREQPLPR